MSSWRVRIFVRLLSRWIRLFPLASSWCKFLGAVAQLERSIIRERSVAGQLAALRRGVALGRKNNSTPPETVEKCALPMPLVITRIHQ